MAISTCWFQPRTSQAAAFTCSRTAAASSRSPVFAPGVRLADTNANISISYPGGEPLVMTPGREYPNFRPMFLTAGTDVPFKPKFYIGRGNHWTRVDFDGDKALDLVVGVGDWREYGWDDAFDRQGRWTHGPLHGYVYVMRNEGSNARPRFGEPVQLLAGGNPLDMFGAPTPQFADWDRDGDLDLVCGEFLDRLTYFENTGSRHKPVYAAGRFLESQHQVIHLDLEMITPTAFDWDQDGDVDLVVGQEDGRVALLENTGKLVERVPQFKPPVFLRQEADLVKCGAWLPPIALTGTATGTRTLFRATVPVTSILSRTSTAAIRRASPRRVTSKPAAKLFASRLVRTARSRVRPKLSGATRC